MSINIGKLGVKLLTGVATAAVTVLASAATEKAINHVFAEPDTDTADTTDTDVETDTEETEEK